MKIINIHITPIVQDAADSKVLAIGSILEPNPIIFSFDTLGWKILLVCLLLLVLILIKKRYRIYQTNAYRRIGLKKLQNISLSSNLDNKFKINSSMFILKEIALESYPRNKVASLTGVNWLKFLTNSCKETDFIQFNKFIEDAIFKNSIEPEGSNKTEELISLGIKWVKNHA